MNNWQKDPRYKPPFQSLVDWFDPTNAEHLKAYEHLQDVGFWPRCFTIPPDVKFPTGWESMLYHRLADLYVKEKLGQ